MDDDYDPLFGNSAGRDAYWISVNAEGKMVLTDPKKQEEILRDFLIRTAMPPRSPKLPSE